MKPKKNIAVDGEDIKSRAVYVLSGLVLVIAFILCLVEYKKIDMAGASIESSLSVLEDSVVSLFSVLATDIVVFSFRFVFNESSPVCFGLFTILPLSSLSFSLLSILSKF